jgi:cytochrome c biogenesis factor
MQPKLTVDYPFWTVVQIYAKRLMVVVGIAVASYFLILVCLRVSYHARFELVLLTNMLVPLLGMLWFGIIHRWAHDMRWREMGRELAVLHASMHEKLDPMLLEKWLLYNKRILDREQFLYSLFGKAFLLLAMTLVFALACGHLVRVEDGHAPTYGWIAVGVALTSLGAASAIATSLFRLHEPKEESRTKEPSIFTVMKVHDLFQAIASSKPFHEQLANDHNKPAH